MKYVTENEIRQKFSPRIITSCQKLVKPFVTRWKFLRWTKKSVMDLFNRNVIEVLTRSQDFLHCFVHFPIVWHNFVWLYLSHFTWKCFLTVEADKWILVSSFSCVIIDLRLILFVPKMLVLSFASQLGVHFDELPQSGCSLTWDYSFSLLLLRWLHRNSFFSDFLDWDEVFVNQM